MTKRKMLKGGSLSPDVIQGLLKKSYEKKPSSFNDYQIDKSLSGERVQVYYNPALKQAVVVHRGSAGAKDWLVNDAGLMVGYRGNRFSHAQDIQNKAEKKYGAKNVTTLGHSLGAKVAEEVGQNSKEIITLNKPTVDAKKVSSKQYDIRASSDVVSGLSGIATSNNKTTIPSGFRNPYSEHSPDVLSRLDDKKIGRGMKGGVVPPSLDPVTTARNHIRQQLRQINNINQTENKYHALVELREYAYRRQGEHGGLRAQIRSIEAEMARVGGTPAIGFGNLKGGKKAEERPKLIHTTKEFDDMMRAREERRNYLEEQRAALGTQYRIFQENENLTLLEQAEAYNEMRNRIINGIEALGMTVTEQAPFIALANRLQDNIDLNVAQDRDDDGEGHSDEEEGQLAIQNPANMEGAGLGNIFRRTPNLQQVYIAPVDEPNPLNQLANPEVRSRDENIGLTSPDRRYLATRDEADRQWDRYIAPPIASPVATAVIGLPVATVDDNERYSNLNFEDFANRDADMSEVSYSDPDSDDSNPINFLGDYTPSSSDSDSYYDLGNTPRPSGAGRFDGYSQCHDCGCDSYRDFNALHAM